jgi:hypothetical protein
MRKFLPLLRQAAALTRGTSGRRQVDNHSFRPSLQVLEDRMNLSSTSLVGAAALHARPDATGIITLGQPIVPGMTPPPPGHYGPMSVGGGSHVSVLTAAMNLVTLRGR